MMTVLLVIHLMVAAALVGVVLLQRSEGGALGIGGGGAGSSGFLTGRGQANLLTRVTAGLALAFFTTSILLTIVGNQTGPKRSVFDSPATTTAPAADGKAAPTEPAAPATDGAPAEKPSGGILDKLN